MINLFKRVSRNALAVFSGAAISALMLGAVSAQTIDPNAAYGYAVEGRTGAGIVLAEPHPSGSRAGIFMLIAPDADSCIESMPQSGVWADLCVSANKKSGNRLRIPFLSKPQKGALVQGASLSAEKAGFPFELTVLLNSNDDVLSVSASEVGGPLSPKAFTDERARFEAIRTMDADETTVTAALTAGGFALRLDLGAVQAAGQRSAKISFFYRHDDGRDCMRNLRQPTSADGWLALCELADKDGLQELSGVLQPINGGAGHVGLMTTSDGAEFHAVISQARQGFALLGIRRASQPSFSTTNAVENVILDGLVPGNPPAPPPAPQASGMTGYRVFGEAGMALTITPQPAPQPTKTMLTMIAKNVNDCIALASNTTALERVCEKMDKDDLQQMVFSGELNAFDDGRSFAGNVQDDASGIALTLENKVQGTRVATMTVRGEGRAGTFLMTGEKAMFDRLASTLEPPQPAESSEPILGYRLGAFTVAEVELSPLRNGEHWSVRFKLDAKVDEYGYDKASRDCYRTVSDTDYIWGRQCEKASKDGVPFEVSGTLLPVSWRRDAFSGEVQSADGGWTWQMLVVNPTQRRFDVALTDRRDPNFTGDYLLLEFDTMARPLEPSQPVVPPSPGAGENCDTLVAMMTTISRSTQYPFAVQALSDAGFWGGLLPRDAEGCVRAIEVLTNGGFVEGKKTESRTSQPQIGSKTGWPAAGSALYSKIIGSDDARVQLTSNSAGEPIIRIPRFSRCISRQPICQAMAINPGDVGVFNLAAGEDHTIGMFNLGGQLYLVRIENQDDNARMSFISEIAMEKTMGLGVLTEQ